MIALVDLKQWLALATADTTYDALVIGLESRAVDFVERVTSRYFGANGSTTEIVCGAGQKRLWLEEPATNTATQAITVTYVAEVGDSATTITATAADGWQTRTDGNEGYLVRKGGNVWEKGYEYTVVYRRGYTVTATGTIDDIAAPGEIRQLVIDLVAQKYRMREHGDGAVIAETIDNYSYRLGDFSDSDFDTMPWARSVIEKWRRPNV